MPSRFLLLLTVVALTLTTPAPMRAWQLDHLRLKRAVISSALQVIETETSADFDGDGALETLIVTNGRAVIQTEGQTRWQSPPAWDVTQAQITNLDRDGLPEVTLLVWRQFKPWPVDTWLPHGGRIQDFHDASGRSCHILLIGWKRNAFRELWAGSALAEPVDHFAAVDSTGDGRQYLFTLTGKYDDLPSAPSRRLKVWEWNGFGFTVVHELESSFHRMVPVQTEAGRVLILTD